MSGVAGDSSVREDTQPPSMNPLRTLRSLSVPVRVLLTGVMINRMGSLVAIFLALYATSLGFSPARAGILVTGFGSGSILGVLAGGWACDRFGPRRTIVTSMAGTAASLGLLPVLTGYGQLFALCFVAGAFSQLYRPAALVLLSRLSPPGQLVMYTAAYRLALNLGAAAAPLLGGALVAISYRWLFYANAATAAAFAVVAIVALPDVHAGRARPRGSLPNGPSPRSAGAVLRNPRYGLVLGGMLLITLIEAQAQTIVPLQITSLGHPVALYAAAIALNAVLVILLELPLTPLVQRLPINIAIAAGAALTGLGFALFFVPAGAWIFFAAVVVWTAGEIANAPSVNAYPAMIASDSSRGQYVSALNTSQALGQAAGPAVGSALYQFAGSAVFVVDLVLGAVATVLMYLGVVRNPRPPAV